MQTSQRNTVVGVFEDRRQAQLAVEELKRAGFTDSQIGVISRNADVTSTTTDETGSHVAEGAATGAAAGAGVGALWALGIAAGILPAIGPVIAGGLLTAVLASAAGGAAVAGIVGALIGLGIPEDEAQYYEGEFMEGRTLVTVSAGNRINDVKAIIQRHGGYDRSSQRTTDYEATSQSKAKRATTSGTTTGTGQPIKVHEEQLNVHKQPVKTGEVRVRKEVTTEQKTIPVSVSREEVVVERHPASGTASSSDIHAGEEIRIPVMEEQVKVDKEAVVKEEVTVGKRKTQDTEKVSGTVRKEHVKVEREGDVDVNERSTTKKDKRK